jgi:hypothetical protein
LDGAGRRRIARTLRRNARSATASRSIRRRNMDKDEKFINKCFKEMFKRVGEKWPAKWPHEDKEWYTKRTWTEKEQDSFKKWLVKEFSKAYPYHKRKAEYEASLFILCYGWKTEWVK